SSVPNLSSKGSRTDATAACTRRRPVALLRLHRIVINPIHDPPRPILVLHTQFVAAAADGRHCPRLRHAELHSPLEAAEENPRLDPCVLREGRGLDLALQPDEGLVRLSGHTGR